MHRASLHKNLVIGARNSDWFVTQLALCVITLSFPYGRREKNERFKWRNNPPGCWRRVFSTATVLVSFHLFDSLQQHCLLLSKGAQHFMKCQVQKIRALMWCFKIWLQPLLPAWAPPQEKPELELPSCPAPEFLTYRNCEIFSHCLGYIFMWQQITNTFTYREFSLMVGDYLVVNNDWII